MKQSAKKLLELWRDNKDLHHNNAPAHSSMLVRDFLAKYSTNMILQAPYSPNVTPCDFFLFLRLKLLLHGHRFESIKAIETIEAIKRNSLRVLNTILEIHYQRCFEDWKKRWHKCIAVGGDYFEGDTI